MAEQMITIEVKKCSVDGCNNPAISKGLCANHYRRLLAYGDPLASKRASWGTETKVVGVTVPVPVIEAIAAKGEKVATFLAKALLESEEIKSMIEDAGLSVPTFVGGEEQAEKKPRKKKSKKEAA